MSLEAVRPRWSDYLLRGAGDFAPFWQEFLSQQERRLLFVMGHGFDERMCACSDAILSAGGSGIRDALVIEYDEGLGSSSHSYRPQRDQNGARLDALFSGRGKIGHRPIKMFSDDGRRVGARSIANEFSSMAEFWSYSDVLVDISALPRGL